MVSSVSASAATPAAAASTPSVAGKAASASTGTSDADNAKAMRFQYALTAALNAPHVLGGAGGSTADDDNEDGSNLTAKVGM